MSQGNIARQCEYACGSGDRRERGQGRERGRGRGHGLGWGQGCLFVCRACMYECTALACKQVCCSLLGALASQSVDYSLSWQVMPVDAPSWMLYPTQVTWPDLKAFIEWARCNISVVSIRHGGSQSFFVDMQAQVGQRVPAGVASGKEGSYEHLEGLM